MLFATTFGDRCDPRVGLHLLGKLESIAVAAESSEQSQRQSLASAIECLEDRRIAVLGKQVLDLLVVGLNGRRQLAQLLDQGLHHHRGCFDDGAVGGQRLGLADRAYNLDRAFGPRHGSPGRR